jgi:hypothetical protein
MLGISGAATVAEDNQLPAIFERPNNSIGNSHNDIGLADERIAETVALIDVIFNEVFRHASSMSATR